MPKLSQVSVAESVSPQVNRYYQKMSRRYLAAFAILLTLTVLFIGCVIILFGEYVTYDNLKYFVRDWNAVSLRGDGDFSRIVYNGSEDMRFVSFRGGLAVCSRDSFSYYDTTGVQLISEMLNYDDPAAVPSEKYLLLYDVGGTQYSIYNQLTQIVSRTEEGRIVAGDIADNGSAVLVMRSRETKYVAKLYNAAFNRTMSIYKENYVIDAGISDDGESIVLVSAVPENTDFSCEIELCLADVSEPLAKLTLEHTMPLRAYTGEAGFILLCDTGVYFYDYAGHRKTETLFSGMNLRYADANGETFAVVGSVNALGSENRVMVFDWKGAVLYDGIIRERIRGAYASLNPEDVLLWLSSTDSVMAVEADGTLRKTETEPGDILSVVPMKTGAVVAQKNGAYKIN